MSNRGNENKANFLGMPYGTATARLRKIILFNLLSRVGDNTCYRCGKKIDAVDELSIDHKKAWLNVSVDLFWDLDNITFSHLSCNCSYGKRQNKRETTHGTHSGYSHSGCRCNYCVTAQREYQESWRDRKLFPVQLLVGCVALNHAS